jgi:hypothetical protein
MINSGPQSSKIKLATPLSSKRKHREEKVAPSNKSPVGIPSTPIDVVEDTPEEIEQKKQIHAHTKALTFQYLNTLKVNFNVNLPVRIQGSGKGHSKLISETYAKYQGDKAAVLQQLISLMSDIGEEASNRLLNGGWLGQTEVDHYFTLLAKEHPDVYCVGSDASRSINNLIRGLKKPGSKEAQKMRAANKIFWPICEGSHWFLMIMNKNEDQSYNVSCLNSLGWNEQQITAKAKIVLQTLYPQADKDKLVKEPTSIKVPNQHNGDDCGVAACYWGAKIINGDELPKNISGDCDYSQYRFDIAEAFAKQVAKEKASEKPKPTVIVIDDEEEVKSSKAIIQLRNRKFK